MRQKTNHKTWEDPHLLAICCKCIDNRFFSYESFKSCVGELEPKSYMILGHAHWHFPEAFSSKLPQQSKKKNRLFKRKSFDEKPFPRLDESFKRDFLCISIHALKGLCYANDVSRRILLMTSLMTQPFLFCTNRQISRCELVSLW